MIPFFFSTKMESGGWQSLVGKDVQNTISPSSVLNGENNKCHMMNHIGGVMISVLASSVVDRGFKLIFDASPLSTQH
jgi:hypothetical protein